MRWFLWFLCRIFSSSNKSNYSWNQYHKSNTLNLGDLIKHTDEKVERISSFEKKLFWTLPQYEILNDVSKKRVIFISEFGTGKTTLIRTKAKLLLEEGKKVIIISFEDRESTAESLLTTSLKAEFGRIVHRIRGSGYYSCFWWGTYYFN